MTMLPRLRFLVIEIRPLALGIGFAYGTSEGACKIG